MQIIVKIENSQYVIDEKELNPKQIEIIFKILGIPFDLYQNI